MDANEFYHKIKEKILHLGENSWEKRLNWVDVEHWLSNFKETDGAQNEQIQMLYLLSQFMYFGRKEMREMLRSVFRDKFQYMAIETIRSQHGDTVDCDFIGGKFNEELNRTRFLGVGNPSESGTHLLYYFRQENGLPKNLFINTHEIFNRSGGVLSLKNPDVTHYVFLDDMCGSGDQATSYSESLVRDLKDKNKDAIVHYYTLFAMSAGIDHIKKNTEFDVVESIFELDDSFRCFSPDSRHFKNIDNPVDKKYSEEICNAYGKKLFPGHALGYKNCQLLLGFNHNTPDNTLPVIWCDDGTIPWIPIFKRYNKKYGWKL